MKEINTIEMVRKIRDKQYEQTKDMTKKELMSFFGEKAQLANKKALKSIRGELVTSESINTT